MKRYGPATGIGETSLDVCMLVISACKISGGLGSVIDDLKEHFFVCF